MSEREEKKTYFEKRKEKYKPLEKKSGWRLFKVIFIIIAVIVSISISTALADEKNEQWRDQCYRDPHVRTGFFDHLVEENGGYALCNKYGTFSDITKQYPDYEGDVFNNMVVFSLVGFAGYLGIKRLSLYVVDGSDGDN